VGSPDGGSAAVGAVDCDALELCVFSKLFWFDELAPPRPELFEKEFSIASGLGSVGCALLLPVKPGPLALAATACRVETMDGCDVMTGESGGVVAECPTRTRSLSDMDRLRAFCREAAGPPRCSRATRRKYFWAWVRT
jgi:hypothetical protein